ncbi:uncharacterized protein LOC111323175 [Stylophora pistillata]|uniref:Right handed beta helix domain-containing protein n=1 Tax=Stylophora pistillata TaxID=50429 RepID=A0A2B4SNJ3_STYPI|nr:uncharacterized protein LOC111323175 [Stylophora pistillata]XP_022782212.1 uncharacterized protein LOC111323175 [Stylophora pistillata]PFX30689.1 hypothetical protein AWC38_SpisGene4462 [Stylophora pistillata]
MAFIPLLSCFLQLLVLPSVKAGTEDQGPRDIFVSLSGRDTENCGPVDEPCQSISQALDLIAPGGCIHLNGTGTIQTPFNCTNRMARDHYQGLYIKKSVTMKGFQSTPYVSCVGGIHFEGDPTENRSKFQMMVTLSGIVFKGTPIEFQDCSNIHLMNCSHQESKTAVSVRALKAPSVSFDIQGPSLFRNNYHCVEILLHGTSHLIASISQTKFISNGIDGQHSAKGLISIMERATKSTKQSGPVQISCYKISCVGNWVPFVVLELKAAVTKETYSHIELVDNNLQTPFSSKSRRFKDSMYISRTRKVDVTFTHMHCANNKNDQALRCIKIYTDEAKVSIDHSAFVGQNASKGNGGAIFLESTKHASLVVTNTVFERNEANAGGAVYLNIVHNATLQNMRLSFTNVNFTECVATTDGSAILVGKTHKPQSKPLKYALYASLKKVNAINCVSHKLKYRFGSFCLTLHSGLVIFDEFNWTNTRPNAESAVYIGTTGGNTNVTIVRSSFIGGKSNQSAFVGVQIFGRQRGIVTVKDTSMTNNSEGALDITPKCRIRLENVTVASCMYGLQLSKRWLSQETGRFLVSILITSCSFKRNVYDLSLNVSNPRSIWLKVNDSIFTGRPNRRARKGYAIGLFVPPIKKNMSCSADIELDRVTFHSRPSSIFVLYFKGKKTTTIRRTVFRYCTALSRQHLNFGEHTYIYETSTGAVSILSIPDEPWKLGCVQRDDINNTHPLWRYESHVTIEDTLFQENAGFFAGAVYISNGNTTFKNCSFQNNLAIWKRGQVYSAYGTGRVEFNDCTFSSRQNDKVIDGKNVHNAAFFYSESEGPIVFRNTTMISTIPERKSHYVLEIFSGGYVDMDYNTTVQCSKGSMLILENASHFAYTEKRRSFCRVNVTAFRYACKLCSSGYYSLETGKANGFTVNTSFECHPCPLGATCMRNDINIAAKPNFWGYEMRNSHPSPSLKFIPCPNNYCQSPSRKSIDYNSCRGNRTGYLCGKCAPGYTESLFSTSCRKMNQCSDYLLWLVVILFTAGMAAYLVKKPPLLRYLSFRQIFWFLKNREHNELEPREERGQVDDEETDNGYLKIVFYYYQVADLFVDESLAEKLRELRIPFVNIVVSAYNFQVNSIYKGIGCPFVGLTAVTKQLFLSLDVFITMGNVVFIYCVHFVVNMVRKKNAPSVHHYMAVILEILLLGYDRLAETSLNLMHCVPVRSEQRLFIDGNTVCWRPWQYVLLGYGVVFVVPFIAVLYYGSKKLHKSSISATMFLTACVVPLPFLVYWLFVHVCKKRGENSATRPNDGAEEVKKVLQGPFRRPNDQDGDRGTLYWESVLIGRRLILLSVHSFIPNAMLRALLLAVSCELMAIHHFVKKPFQHITANRVESVSLVVLSIMAIINLTKATLLSSGIAAVGENKLYIEYMQWFQIVSLAFVPALLILLAVFAILSLIVRMAVTLVKKVAQFIPSGPNKVLVRGPLLGDWRGNIQEDYHSLDEGDDH